MSKYGLVGSSRIEFHKLFFLFILLICELWHEICADLHLSQILRRITFYNIADDLSMSIWLATSGTHSTRAQPARHPVHGALAYSSPRFTNHRLRLYVARTKGWVSYLYYEQQAIDGYVDVGSPVDEVKKYASYYITHSIYCKLSRTISGFTQSGKTPTLRNWARKEKNSRQLEDFDSRSRVADSEVITISEARLHFF
jgi:hypothetical protein